MHIIPSIKYKNIILTTILGCSVTLLGCQKQAEQANHGGMPPAAVAIQIMQPQQVPFVLELPATLFATEEVAVKAQVSGILTGKHFKEGEHVTAGTSLFSIDNKPFAIALESAKANLEVANAQLAQAQRLVTRLKPLQKDNSVPKQQYDDAVSQQQIMLAQVNAAKANYQSAKLSMSYTNVTAPISGVISREVVSVGNYIANSQQILSYMTQDDPIKVRFGLSDRQLQKLNDDAKAGLLTMPANGAWSVRIKLQDGSFYPNLGKVNFTEVRVDPNTGTRELQAIIPNPKHQLHTGQFVRVLLEGAVRENAYVLPQQAVLDNGTGKFVYLMIKNKQGMTIASPAPVKVGEWVRNNEANHITNGWIIKKGLHAGEQVITDGMARIFFPGMPVQLAKPAGQQATNTH